MFGRFLGCHAYDFLHDYRGGTTPVSDQKYLRIVVISTLCFSRWIGKESLIGISPGLGLHPKQTAELIDSSMIQFNYESETEDKGIAGWKGYADRAKEFLDNYDPSLNALNKDCTKDNGADDKACKFDLAQLGECQTYPYGYDKGEPCVFLKLNRIFGVSNDPYGADDELPEGMPEDLKKHIKAQGAGSDSVWIDCQGEYPADREALTKNIQYFPSSRGLPNFYFPYAKQSNYMSPLVAVKFKNLTPGQLVHIECRAWAKNIDYNKRDRIGINHLEIHRLTNSLVAEMES